MVISGYNRIINIKKMDQSTLVMGVIFTVATFGPITYLIWLGKNRTHKVKKVLHQFGEKKQLKFSEHEVWNDKALGIDQVNKKLVSVDMKFSENPCQIVDLKKAKNCKIQNTGDVIQIIIGMNNYQGSKIYSINIFDVNTDDPVDRGFYELLAKKWMRLIEESIGKAIAPSKAAWQKMQTPGALVFTFEYWP